MGYHKHHVDGSNMYFNVQGNYVAYLSSGSVGQIDITGQHRALPADDRLLNNLESYKGKDVNEAVPEVLLSNKYKDKRVFGVISDGEDENNYTSHKKSDRIEKGQREKIYQIGSFGTVIIGPEEDYRLYINSVGEGGIWVCDEYGIIENGDYITSSNYEGYGCAQDDD